MTVEPEAVLGIRPSLSPTHPAAEVLIKWKNLPEHEASWEPSVMIKEQFPEFHLEDKVSLQPGGIDKPPIHFTYKRRKGSGTSKERVGDTWIFFCY